MRDCGVEEEQRVECVEERREKDWQELRPRRPESITHLGAGG